MPCWWVLTRTKQLSMAATARVIWLCACVRYCRLRGWCLSVSLAFLVIRSFLPSFIQSSSPKGGHLRQHSRDPLSQLFLIVTTFATRSVSNIPWRRKAVPFEILERKNIFPWQWNQPCSLYWLSKSRKFLPLIIVIVADHLLSIKQKIWPAIIYSSVRCLQQLKSQNLKKKRVTNQQLSLQATNN